MSEPLVQIQTDGPSTTVLTLNRPERRNALTIALMEELIRAVKKVEKDKSQRVLVLTGSGNTFCAGLDLREASSMADAEKSAHAVAQMLRIISQTPLVTIAAVHGTAIAGGAGLMSSCDFVVAAHDAKMGYPEVRRGLVAGLVTTLLKYQLRERDIRELLLTGELISANRAQTMGLVNRVVPSQDVMKEVSLLAVSILEGGPEAQARTKRVLEEMRAGSMERDFEIALKHHMEARHSEEAREGIAAFLEKRLPRWADPKK